MPYQDFRQFLDVLRQHGELIDINRPVALNDIGKAMKHSYARQGPALMFNQNGTDYPLVAGLYSTRSKALLAFEADEDTIFDKVLDGLDHPIPPKRYSGKAPCQDETITRRRHRPAALAGSEIQPEGRRALHHARHRRVARPETGMPDIGHYRFLILGKDTVSFSAQPFHRFGKHLAKHKKLGTVPKAALVIGVDPILAYTCQVQVPDDTNDWNVAGGLARRAGRTGALHAERSRNSGDRGGRVRVRGRSRQHRDGRAARRIHRLLHAAVDEAGRARHRDHAPQEADLPGPAHRQAGDREPHPQAGAVRGLVLPHAEEAVSDHHRRVGARLRRRVVLRRHRDEPALRRGGAAGDPRRDGEQHPAEMGGDRRSRHRRAQLRRSRMGDGVPRAAAARRDRDREHARRPVRSFGRSEPRTGRCASRRASGSMRRSRSASRSTRWPMCRTGRISRCPNSTAGGKGEESADCHPREGGDQSGKTEFPLARE